MPFFVRSVSPVRISVLPDDVRSAVVSAHSASQRGGEPILELELFSHQALVSIIRQLSAFCAHSSDLLSELGSSVRAMNERCRRLTERVQRIQQRAQSMAAVRSEAPTRLKEMQSRRTYYSGHMDAPVRNLLLRKRSKSQSAEAEDFPVPVPALCQSAPELLFCERPSAVERLYERAQPLPALRTLNEYHDGPVDAASFYSNPAFYSNVPVPSQLAAPQTASASSNATDCQSVCSLPNATPSVYDSAYATHSAGSSDYGSVRSGSSKVLARVGRDELVSKMRQVRLEQNGLFPAPPDTSTTDTAAATNGSGKLKSVNFNLDVCEASSVDNAAKDAATTLPQPKATVTMRPQKTSESRRPAIRTQPHGRSASQPPAPLNPRTRRTQRTSKSPPRTPSDRRPRKAEPEVDLKQAVLKNLAMNGARSVNYVAPGGAFGQPSAQMLSTIQSILTSQAIGDARSPQVVHASAQGVQLRSTLKLKGGNEPPPADGGRDRLSKELLDDIKKGLRLRQVSFADDANGVS